MNIRYQNNVHNFFVTENRRIVYYPYHIHNHLEILYVRRGVQPIKVENKEYEIKAGDAAVIFPNTAHSYWRDVNIPKKNDGAESVCILCNSDVFNGLFFDFEKYRPKEPVIEHAGEDEVVAIAASRIRMKKYNVDSLDTDYDDTDNIGWTILLLSHLLKKMSFEKNSADYYDNISLQIMRYINENFKEAITLDDLAERFYLNKNYVSRILSEKLKINLRRYINTKRSEYAAGLLRSSGKKMQFISDDSGFDSVRNFNRIFKECYGVTPSQYRKGMCPNIEEESQEEEL